MKGSDCAHRSSDAARNELLTAWSARYRRPLLKFFQRRMPDHADREDMVQEVFLRLSRRDDLEEIRRVDSYLFEAAANVLKDWKRRQVTRAADAHDPISSHILDVEITPERVLLGKEALASFTQAFGELPERTRAIFMLYHFERMTHTVIAKRLGIAVRTVEDNMARANVHFIKRLGVGRK